MKGAEVPKYPIRQTTMEKVRKGTMTKNPKSKSPPRCQDKLQQAAAQKRKEEAE